MSLLSTNEHSRIRLAFVDGSLEAANMYYLQNSYTKSKQSITSKLVFYWIIIQEDLKDGRDY